MIEIFIFGLRNLDEDWLPLSSFDGLSKKLKKIVSTHRPKIKEKDIACLSIPTDYAECVVVIIEGLTDGTRVERILLSKDICHELVPHISNNAKEIRCRIRISRNTSGTYRLKLK